MTDRDDQPDRAARPVRSDRSARGGDKPRHKIRIGRTSERDRRRVRGEGERTPRRSTATRVRPPEPAVPERRKRRERPEKPAKPERGRERLRKPPARPSRRRVLVRRWVALLIVIGAGAFVVALYFTPLLGVGSVDVTGVPAAIQDQVRTAADVRDGTPMLRLETGAIATRVRALPIVSSVDVSRQWPSTVRIDITVRTPVGVFTGPGGVHLVDATGFDYAVVAQAPPGLPVIQLPKVAPDDPRTQAVVKVLGSLPVQLRPRVIAIGAQTPGGVQLAIAGGKTVVWGDADNAARKAAVLAALLTQPGKVYDVSAPDLPTIS